MGDLSPLLQVLSILSIPYQLMHEFIFEIGNMIVFDVLQLGPFLPIQLNF